MAIYRGAGGAGDATADSTSQAIIAVEAAANAQASATSAASSASSAATSASNAATSATNAASSASAAATSVNLGFHVHHLLFVARSSAACRLSVTGRQTASCLLSYS